MNAAGTPWHSNWALAVSTSYTVTASAAEPGGKPVTNDQLVQHADAGQHLPDHDLRGLPPELRRRHADHADVQPARSPTRRRSSGRCSSPPPSRSWGPGTGTATCDLNFRPREYWPAHTKVTFTGHLDGVEGAPGRVRQPHADPVVHHRPVADRGGQHGHPPHGPVPERQAATALADQHRPAGRQHPERHLPDHRKGQPGADEGPRLPAGGALVGPVHLVAATTCTTRSGRWASRASPTSATAA